MSGLVHLDQTVAQELRNIMGEDFPLLVQTFVRDSTQRIESFREAMKMRDADALCRAAHSFKGSAGNMGAVHLADLCRSLEALGRTNDLQGVPTLIDEILNEYGTVERALMTMLR